MKNFFSPKLKWLVLVFASVVCLAPSSSLAQIIIDPNDPLPPPQSYQLALPPGISLVANPLYCFDYRVARLFPRVPIGTTFSKLDTRTGKFSFNIFGFRGWSNPNETLTPGEGAVMLNPTRQTNTVTVWSDAPGFAISIDLGTDLPAGLSLVSIPGVNFNVAPAGSFPLSLNFPIWPFYNYISFVGRYFNPQDGDVVWTVDHARRRITPHTFRTARGWDSLPEVGDTESFFVQLAHPHRVEFYYIPSSGPFWPDINVPFTVVH